jgi:hypothetical protein
MALTSGSISSLIQGVSQQPQALRTPSQLEAQENCYSSPVEGLTNRPPTEHIAKISTTPFDDALMHTINRSAALRFKAIFQNGWVDVFGIDGTQKTINTEDETVVLGEGLVAAAAGQTFILAPADGETAIDFTVSGLGVGTVTLQVSVDGAAWTTIATRNTNGTTTGAAFTADDLYMRVNVTAYTSGTIKATATYKNWRYLVTETPSTDMRCVTVADTTFIVNRSKTAAMLSDTTTDPVAEGLVFVRQGNYSSNYAIYIDGVQRAIYTTSDTLVNTLRTDGIAVELYNDLVAWGGAGFTFGVSGSVVYISKSSGDFALQAIDSHGGSDLSAIKDSVAKFTDLPAYAPDGFVVGINANPDVVDSEAYYVQAVVNQDNLTFGDCTWEECPAPGVEYIIDQTVMPHKLTRETNGTFTYAPVAWTDRVCGDDTTNSQPSFIGQTINDVFFYKNRLGLLADENFILSEVGEYYNFWRTTITSLKDSDVVDSRASHTKVSILENVVAFNKSLIMFSDQTQFAIPGDVAMTPNTVRCDVVSEFESNVQIRPVNAGKVIYFMFDRGDYAGIKELSVSNTTAEIMEADEVTAHTPAYIPSGVTGLSVSTLLNLAAVTTSGDPGSVYLYKTEWKQEKKVQAALFRWNFDDDTASTVSVLSADFIESTLYILIQRNDEVFLEKIDLLPNRVDSYVSYVTLLDRRITDDDCTVAYDANTNRTTYTLPYEITSTEMAVITRGIADNTGMADVGKVLQVDSASVGSTTLTVVGDYETNPVWIGQRYYCEAELSTIYIRKQSLGGGLTIDAASNLQLLRGYVKYDTSGAFTVSVTPQGRNVSNYVFNGRITGDINNVLGTVALASGIFKFGILSNNERVTITINSNSHLKFSITGLDWEGEFTKRSA